MGKRAGQVRNIDLQPGRALLPDLPFSTRRVGFFDWYCLRTLLLKSNSPRPGGSHGDPDPRCVDVAPNELAAGSDAQDSGSRPEAQQGSKRRDVTNVPAKSNRLRRINRRRKDTTGMSTTEFLPDPTCSSEFSPRSIALAANSGEVSAQPMHVGPSTDIAVTNESYPSQGNELRPPRRRAEF